MLQAVKIQNLGPISQIKWDNLGRINLIIGNNACGKTFLLKALYCAVRTIETSGRGHDPKTAEEILADRLYWTFQPGKNGLGELVTKGRQGNLEFEVIGDKTEQVFNFAFGPDTEKKIGKLKNSFPPRDENSIFLPAKEVLSLFHIIEKSREIDKVFGFDDTYLELVKALKIATSQGKNYESFANARKRLETMLEGKVSYENEEWQFKKANTRFSIHAASEGVKKIAILDRLLGNRYLSVGSVIFIDEPESALHPSALIQFLEIVAELAKDGIQFFIASHSYYVIKKMLLIAQGQLMSIPFLSLDKDGYKYDNLLTGMPQNNIIAESVKLYEEESEQAFK